MGNLLNKFLARSVFLTSAISAVVLVCAPAVAETGAVEAEAIAAQTMTLIAPKAAEAVQTEDAPVTVPAIVEAAVHLPARAGIEAQSEGADDVSPPGPEFAKIRPQARKSDYASVQVAFLGKVRPRVRPYILPKTRWEHRPGSKAWTKAAMQAVLSHGRPLVKTVPSDYMTWCPAYKENDEYKRAMFWVGFMSALAKHESTYRQDAVGGGGLWYGLLQILPSTARLYKCKAKTGEALKNGADNLTCATRIMTKTVPRDQIIHGFFPGQKHKYRGITQDWGPMHASKKRNEMSAWTRKQSYCVSQRSLRPKLRPEGLGARTGNTDA